MSKFNLNHNIKINDKTKDIIKFNNNGKIDSETISNFFNEIFRLIFDEEKSHTTSYIEDHQYFKGQYPFGFQYFEIEIHYNIQPTFIEISISSYIPQNLISWGKNEKNCNNILDKINSVIDNTLNITEENNKKEKTRINKLNNSKLKILKEFDSDGNGIIDVIEGGDDFMKLFRKHQSLIKEFDKEYINRLVKISNYLKTKRSNIQEIFLEIRKTKNQSQLNENVGLLKNQIHTYDVVLFHSLSMITSIVKDDLITVNEIYEEFDKLKIFKSDHEKEVSQKLSDIGDGLSTLMYSINSMERNIVSGLNTLSYVIQDGFSDLNNSLSRELQSINSSIDTNNLLTGIQTYQLYKINKQTKGSIE